MELYDICSFVTGFFHLPCVFEVHRVAVCINTSFICVSGQDIHISCTNSRHFAFPFTNSWSFGLFPLFWLLWNTSTARNTHVAICFYFSWIISKEGIAGSYGNFMFNFLTNSRTVFQSGCTMLHLISHVWGFQFFHILLINTCYCFFFFWIITILVGVKWHLIVVFICVSLMTDDVEPVFNIYFHWGKFYSGLLLIVFLYLFQKSEPSVEIGAIIYTSLNPKCLPGTL